MAPSDEDPVCSRGRRDLNDPFFLKGYQVAWRAEDGAGVAIYYVDDDTSTGGDILAATMASQSDNVVHQHPIYHPPTYPCGVLNCSMTFSSLDACDEHYEVSHMFQCRDCHAILPSDQLLDLHLQEAHDNFFLTSVERGTQGYACLVCAKAQFPSIQDRLLHLMVTHGYPKWFRFVPQARPLDEAVQKKKDKWIKNHEQSSKPIITEKANMMDAACHETRQRKHEQRRERQKQKNATIHCKFHLTSGGCWRGDKCMFRHAGEQSTPTHDVDNLTNDLVSKAKVSVPDNISFGRKRR